ncbi:ImmA/IrrE family metallo-endopeptidase [Candidatus Dojkabacteria bacterium]|nr:ImmA/IrrE family metallo-endopeptidase [Candidatus Dojkabacteria bacterium]
MDIYTTIASTIREKRKKLGLSQDDLARLVGVASTTISMYEQGERKPELTVLKKIADALSIPLAELINIEIPRDNLNIALRSQNLDFDEVEKVKDYISELKYQKRLKSGTKPNKMRARKEASKLLRELKITEAPVKLSVIVNYLEIDPIVGDENILKKTSAFIDLEDKLLVYKDSDPVVRKRFSVAHEIGHLVMGHDVKNDIFNIDSTDPREIEANMFAAELLMPYDWVKQDMQKHSMNIDGLSRKYWVSKEAMGWRLFKSDALLLA